MAGVQFIMGALNGPLWFMKLRQNDVIATKSAVKVKKMDKIFQKCTF